MKAIIPAAGYATRMYPLTLNTPKTLLEIGDRLMLEYIIEKILELPEINEIIIVTNSRFFSNFEDWRKGFKCSVPVKIIDDKTDSNENRLGAIGDVQLAISSENINEDILIINSDNLFNFHLLDAYDFFKKKNADVICMYNVKTIEEARRMGVAEFDSQNKVIGFVEKPQNPKTTMISMGIYFFTGETVPLFKKYIDEEKSPDKTGEFMEWIYKQKDIYAFFFRGKNDKWFDIGTPEVFEYVRKEFPKMLKQTN